MPVQPSYDTQVAQAQSGAPTDPGMMQPSFSDLAFAKFLQSFPDLSNYVITFKDLTEELPEEGDIRVGVVILTNQADYFYVPVISKAGTIGNIDSVFSYNSKSFMPLTAKTAADIFSSQVSSLGNRVRIPNGVRVNPSVYELVTPPRTGKFAYASTSRLIELLGSMPAAHKTTWIDTLRNNTDVAESLHNFFNLKEMLAALIHRDNTISDTIKPMVAVITEAAGLPEADVAEILNKGYIVRGVPQSTRVAISKSTIHDTKFSQAGSADSGKAFSFVKSDGDMLQGMYMSPIAIEGYPGKATEDIIISETGLVYRLYGTKTSAGSAVYSGEPLDRREFLRKFCVISPLKSIREVVPEDMFIMVTPQFELVSLFKTVGPLSITNLGYSVRVEDILRRHQSFTVVASKNYSGSPRIIGKEIYVPINYPISTVFLDSNRDICGSINEAYDLRESFITSGLGKCLHITFDGAEFSAGGRGIGPEANMMRMLVCQEHIAPNRAESFIKEAKDAGLCQVYMSKEAEISSYGEQRGDGEDQQAGWMPNALGPYNGVGYKPNVNNLQLAAQLQDSQIMEAAMFNELLQNPDLFGLIGEYLPDIDSAVDKLGRILFLMKINVSKLNESVSADNIMTTLASIKNVYRILGESALRLKQLVTLNNVPSQPTF